MGQYYSGEVLGLASAVGFFLRGFDMDDGLLVARENGRNSSLQRHRRLVRRELVYPELSTSEPYGQGGQ